MNTYNGLREKYKPKFIKLLFIAESPPPEANIESSRHFYRSEKIRRDDRLFTNTIKALFKEAANLPESEIQKNKAGWLRKFQEAGFYMIEALEESQEHEVTKKDRQEKISRSLPRLIDRVHNLIQPGTKIILIKSNVFDVAAKPLQDEGFTVLNTQLVDYPGRFNQRAYREKIISLLN